jgi:hypothetical protein
LQDGELFDEADSGISSLRESCIVCQQVDAACRTAYCAREGLYDVVAL